MEKATSKGLIIFNSSPIINLSKINFLGLIKKLYNKIIIPNGVFYEIIIKEKIRIISKI